MPLIRKSKAPEPSLPVYMDPVEYSQLLAIIDTAAPRRVLEWGSGGSTKALLGHCDYVEQYVSIEHVAEWFDRVKAEIGGDPRLSLHLIEPEQPTPTFTGRRRKEERKAWENAAERDRSMFTAYIDFPKSLGQRFDFVLVDGRARSFCLEVGYALLEPGCPIVIHDAQRELYHEPIARLGGRVTFLDPWHAGQICLIRKPG